MSSFWFFFVPSNPKLNSGYKILSAYFHLIGFPFQHFHYLDRLRSVVIRQVIMPEIKVNSSVCAVFIHKPAWVWISHFSYRPV